MQLASARACPGGATIGKLDAPTFSPTVSAGRPGGTATVQLNRTPTLADQSSLRRDKPDGGGVRGRRPFSQGSGHFPYSLRFLPVVSGVRRYDVS